MPDDNDSRGDSRLIDQFGVPIKRSFLATMREQISGTDLQQGRPPFAGHLAGRMRPELLGAIIRAADDGNSYEWRILEEEIEELFPHYYAVLSKRRRQVCQLPITVRPASDDTFAQSHAEFVTDWLETGVLADALFDITDAIGKGLSVCEIIWQTDPGCVRPSKLLWRTPRFFEISWEDGETVWLRDAEGFSDLAPHKFLQHKHPSKSGLNIRSGLTRAVAFLWMYSVFTLRDWAIFTQSYGLPVRVGRYGPEASQSDRNVLWKAVSNIAGDVAAIIPKSMEMEFVKNPDMKAGAELYEKRLDWLNREVSKLVLGSTAGTEAISGGHAVGRQHREVEKDVERFDAGLLATTITRQIIPQMISFTFGPQKFYPILTIGQPDQVPLQEFFPGVAAMIDRGMTVRTREVRERFGLTQPEPGDELMSTKTDIGAGEKPLRALPEDGDADMNTRGRLLRTVLAAAQPDMIDRLSDRVAQEAAGALAGLTDRVRREFERAHDLPDLAERLSHLHLSRAEFATAMARGMALAQLTGQAELLEEMGRLGPEH